jgi:hypothetical protein
MTARSGTLAYEPSRVKAPVLIDAWRMGQPLQECRSRVAEAVADASGAISDVKIPRATHLMLLVYTATTQFLNAK